MRRDPVNVSGRCNSLYDHQVRAYLWKKTTMTEENVAALMRMLLEDRKACDEQHKRQQAQMRQQMERQRERDELEQAQMRKQMERPWERDELEKNQMREQMEMLRKVMEESRQPEKSRTRTTDGEAKLVKLTEQDLPDNVQADHARI